MPTAVGSINGKRVEVLKDTWRTGVDVRRNLVSKSHLLGKESGVTLNNDSKQRCPAVHINIYQSTLIKTELFQHNLINVSYLTAC